MGDMGPYGPTRRKWVNSPHSNEKFKAIQFYFSLQHKLIWIIKILREQLL